MSLSTSGIEPSKKKRKNEQDALKPSVGEEIRNRLCCVESVQSGSRLCHSSAMDRQELQLVSVSVLS